ncbi:MAG: hypothetical protein ACPG5B_04120 [Chitinophagales bacterium]
MSRIHWILLFFMVGLMSMGVLSALYEKHKLDECSKDNIAIVIDKHVRNRRGYFIKYKYWVGDKQFTASEGLDREAKDKVFVGDTIVIQVSCTSPNISNFEEN